MSANSMSFALPAGSVCPTNSLSGLVEDVNIKRIINTYCNRIIKPFLVRIEITHHKDVPTLRQRFGERLRDIRIAKRMVQEEFAEFVGVSPDFISSIERGISAPSFETLEVVASRLELTVSELFDFSGGSGIRKRVKLPRKRMRKGAVSSEAHNKK